MCQLRIEFLDLSLAQPNGDGFCVTDVLSISGGASKVPSVCGENSGQHIVVDFFGADPITLTIRASSAFTFGRHWHIHIAQVNCNSDLRGSWYSILSVHRMLSFGQKKKNMEIKFGHVELNPLH